MILPTQRIEINIRRCTFNNDVILIQNPLY
nr:MAG TPA: hypothetical protein [Caudoviricetes sp.]